MHVIGVAGRELFDLASKFLRTLKFLLLRPGFLTLELLKGKTNPYINPLRLYVVMTLMHFLIFKTTPSGDIFNTDRFPVMTFAPVLQQQAIQEKQEESKMSHQEFTVEISMKVKDSLSFMLYLVAPSAIRQGKSDIDIARLRSQLPSAAGDHHILLVIDRVSCRRCKTGCGQCGLP